MIKYLPAHVIAWRCLWAVLAWPLLFLFLLVVAIGWGPEAAKQIWRDVT